MHNTYNAPLLVYIISVLFFCRGLVNTAIEVSTSKVNTQLVSCTVLDLSVPIWMHTSVSLIGMVVDICMLYYNGNVVLFLHEEVSAIWLKPYFKRVCFRRKHPQQFPLSPLTSFHTLLLCYW